MRDAGQLWGAPNPPKTTEARSGMSATAEAERKRGNAADRRLSEGSGSVDLDASRNLAKIGHSRDAGLGKGIAA